MELTETVTVRLSVRLYQFIMDKNTQKLEIGSLSDASDDSSVSPTFSPTPQKRTCFEKVDKAVGGIHETKQREGITKNANIPSFC